MAKLFRDAQIDGGEWRTYNGEIAFLIRRIPAAKSREVEFRHQGRKQSVSYGKGGTRVEFDVEKAGRIASEKATFALLDSKGCEIEAGDDEAAAIWFGLLGKPVKPGDLVCLDGAWTPEIKGRVFAERPDLATWVVGQADKLNAAAEKDEEGKG